MPKKGKKKKTAATHVTLILDESGSMQYGIDDTIGGFNAYVQTLRDEVRGNCTLTLISFNTHQVRTVHDSVPVDDVPNLELSTYRPAGMTPLLDAIHQGIRQAEERAPSGANVIIAVQTDGLENASREVDLPTLRSLIEQKQAAGWQFTFLGMGIDAFAESTAMGIAASSTINYAGKRSGKTFTMAAQNTARFANTGDAQMMAYTDRQRAMAMGDEEPAKKKEKTR